MTTATVVTVTSRTSLEPPSLIGLPPLVNPHTLPNPHAKVADLVSAAHTTRRVSSDSQAPGRASPSSRISRRTPVPFLLEAFPAPPSHIPGTPSSLTSSNVLNSPSLLASTTSWLPSASASPAVSANHTSSLNSNPMSPCSPMSAILALSLHSNPPPSSPPTGPLPPIPGPSSVASELFATHRAMQSAMTESQRSQSRTEQRPRLSIEVNNPVRGRGRQGSLSSLRNPIYPKGEQKGTIAEEAVEVPCSPPPPPPPPLVALQSPPIFGSVAERRSRDQPRGDSPDIARSCHSHVAATSLIHAADKPDVEDSIANVDMSDLNALKTDNEGDGDDQASRPFPRFPLLPHSSTQSPIDPSAAPFYVHTPRKPSQSLACSVHVSIHSEDMQTRHGAMSPEISQMISATPCLWKQSTPTRSRDPSSSRKSSRSRKRADGVPMPTSAQVVQPPLVTKHLRVGGGDEARCVAGEDRGNESDSSLDLHTPLPELMLRHGMLSPHSKLLPQPEVDAVRLSTMSGLSSSSRISNGSNFSLMSTTSTCSKHPKDARDTAQRRVRHRDGRLLKGGIGLTTGLGWSDSEDEDAPSQLTRRVSSLMISRRASSSSIASYRSSQSQSLSRSISHNVLREVNEADEFGYANRTDTAAKSLPARSKPATRVASVRSTGSSLGRYSTCSASSAGMRTRAGSVSESSVYTPSLASRPNSLTDAHASTGLMPGIREYDDGVTPTRAAFERASTGSLNGGSGADVPHTPSSTASSASLPFPITPESNAEIPHLQPVSIQDKVLPPLPATQARVPSALSQRSHTMSLQRPRVYSNASSVSSSSMRGVPPGELKLTSASSTSTPRQSTPERQIKATMPTVPSCPSLDGTPRPSLSILKSPHPPATSGLPRPTTPSAGQRYTPRPLRLVSSSSPMPLSTSPADVSPDVLLNQAELNQSPRKAPQPGEQYSRPGQVLTYNRNVHDQLKLRTLSLSAGPHRAQAPVVSPGGTQTLFIPSPETGPGPNSALSTPITACSQSPLPSPVPGGEGVRPRPRTGTGMVYRNNLSAGFVPTSRIRVPSTR